MSDFNTKLMTTLFKGESVDEIMRMELESAFNELLRNELTVFLDYEKHDPIGYNTGNSRNGIYERKLKTRFGEISVEIPRDRNGEFKQQSIPSYQRSTSDLEAMVIQMYRKGITTSEIADLIEKMYGAHYTPQTVSNMTKMVQEQVQRFHCLTLRQRRVGRLIRGRRCRGRQKLPPEGQRHGAVSRSRQRRSLVDRVRPEEPRLRLFRRRRRRARLVRRPGGRGPRGQGARRHRSARPRVADGG